jgi:uncharacterized protein YfdQ (DUF2303 family)
MIDESAVTAIAKLARAAEPFIQPATHTPILIGQDGKIINLEQFQQRRSRFRGKFQTTSITEFAAYVKANPGGQGFISAGNGLDARVFFNLGAPDNPGHADWIADLIPQRTAAYTAALDANGKRYGQRELAEWIEDWALHVSIFNPDGNEVSLSAAVAAIRNINISARSEAGHADADFGARRTAMEEIEARSNAGALPARLVMRTEPYPGFEQRDITLRLSVITGDKPQLSLRIVGLEALAEDIAREFRSLLLEQIGDAAVMTIGTFTP